MFRILTLLGFVPAETESISLTGQGDEAATTFIVPTCVSMSGWRKI